MSYVITPTKVLLPAKPPVGSRVDWGHPLTNGLVHCVLMNEGGGDRVNSLSTHGLYDGTFNKIGAATPYWVLTPYGNGIGFAGGASPDRLIRLGKWPNFSSFTIHMNLILADPGNTNNILTYAEQDTTYILAFGRNAGGQLYVQAWSGGGWKMSSSNDATYGTGFASVTGICDTKLRLYVNGTLQNDIESIGALDGNSRNGAIGGLATSDYTACYNDYKGQIINYFLWNRALTSEEVMSMYINPYQFITW